MVRHKNIIEVQQILVENYLLSLGASPKGALEGVADDMSSNRISTNDLDCSNEELLMAIGGLLSEIAKRIQNQSRYETNDVDA